MNNIYKLLEIMAALRDPTSGCPWDREQSFASIAPYTIEEAYEVADAIDRQDLQALREELGDLLLQVVFHAQMAREQRAFDFSDVVHSVCDKLVRRHPHVFGTERIDSAAEQRRAWDEFKARERERSGHGGERQLAGIARALPALSRAEKLGRRAAAVGFDWAAPAEVCAKIDEEVTELNAAIAGNHGDIKEEFGDLLFTIANLARHLDLDPEEALRLANNKFEKRFSEVEDAVRRSGRPWEDFSAKELDDLWKAAKTTS